MTVRTDVQPLMLLGGLIAATLGMALVVFGVVISELFFVGVYLLALGLIAVAISAVLRVIGRESV